MAEHGLSNVLFHVLVHPVAFPRSSWGSPGSSLPLGVVESLSVSDAGVTARRKNQFIHLERVADLCVCSRGKILSASPAPKCQLLRSARVGSGRLLSH